MADSRLNRLATLTINEHPFMQQVLLRVRQILNRARQTRTVANFDLPLNQRRVVEKSRIKNGYRISNLEIALVSQRAHAYGDYLKER